MATAPAVDALVVWPPVVVGEPVPVPDGPEVVGTSVEPPVVDAEPVAVGVELACDCEMVPLLVPSGMDIVPSGMETVGEPVPSGMEAWPVSVVLAVEVRSGFVSGVEMMIGVPRLVPSGMLKMPLWATAAAAKLPVRRVEDFMLGGCCVAMFAMRGGLPRRGTFDNVPAWTTRCDAAEREMELRASIRRQIYGQDANASR